MLFPQPIDINHLDAAIEDLQAISRIAEKVSFNTVPLRILEPRQVLMNYSPAQIRRFERVS